MSKQDKPLRLTEEVCLSCLKSYRAGYSQTGEKLFGQCYCKRFSFSLKDKRTRELYERYKKWKNLGISFPLSDTERDEFEKHLKNAGYNP